MSDHKELRRLATGAGGGKWESGEADGYVFGSDGDSVCVCHANFGAMPEPIYPEHRADFIAAANPSVVLSLLNEIEGLRILLDRLRTGRNGEKYTHAEARDGAMLFVRDAALGFMSPQPAKEEGK